MRLTGKVALIAGDTGGACGARGLGSASARLFAREGAALVIATRHEEPGRVLVKEITDAGGRAIFVELDTVSQDDWDRAVEVTGRTYGGLHILMNMAGSDDAAGFPDLDLEAWDRVFEINLVGTVRGIQTCAPLMKESGGGSIINVGSVSGLAGTRSTAYSACTWGLEGLSRSAAYIYADWGIRCNTIKTGFIETGPIETGPIETGPIETGPIETGPIETGKPVTDDVLAKEAFEQTMNETVLLRRAGRPKEIGYTALFLASEDSVYITGNDIIVDGGFSAAPFLANDRTRHAGDLLAGKRAQDREGVP